RFERTGFADTPAPRQTQMPRATVRTEQRIERGELKPAHVILAGEIVRRHEAGNIRAPEWREAERVVHADRHVRGERGPARLRVARPNPATVTRDAGVAVAMQSPRTLVGTFEQRPFVVSQVTRNACLNRQLVAVVGPPAVHAERKYGPMPCPVVADMQWRVEIRRRARCDRRAQRLAFGPCEVWSTRKNIRCGKDAPHPVPLPI